MGIFWRKNNADKLIIVFHVGSSFVGGTVFRTQTTGIPKILFSIRESIALQKTLDIDKFLFSTTKTLGVVAERIYKAGLGKPEEIFCVLSSPWHVSQTRIIKLEKNTPFIFTAKFAEQLIQKEISIFEEEYLNKYVDTKSPVKSIEFKNIKTVLNGYESPNPINQKARELEMTIFVSISPEQILNKVKEIVGKYYHFEKIHFCSSMLASFAVLRDMMHGESDDFLVVEIGEVTDISMVKKNILRESISFPIGDNFIIRRVASSLRSSTDEAKSYIALLQSGHADDSLVQKIGPLANRLKTEWLVKFQESLANLSSDISVPSMIYLSVDKEMADFFSEAIKNEQFNQYTLTESKFKVVFLDVGIFHGLAIFKNDAVRDPRAIVDSVYINRFLMSAHTYTELNETAQV